MNKQGTAGAFRRNRK